MDVRVVLGRASVRLGELGAERFQDLTEDLRYTSFGEAEQGGDFSERQAFVVVQREDGLLPFRQLFDECSDVPMERVRIDSLKRFERLLVRDRLEDCLFTVAVSGCMERQSEAALGVPKERVIFHKCHFKIFGDFVVGRLSGLLLPQDVDGPLCLRQLPSAFSGQGIDGSEVVYECSAYAAVGIGNERCPAIGIVAVQGLQQSEQANVFEVFACRQRMIGNAESTND